MSGTRTGISHDVHCKKGWKPGLLQTLDIVGLLSITGFVDAKGLCRLEASTASMQQAFFTSSVNPERAPWRLAAIQRGLCILERKSFSSREVHQRLKRFYGKLHLVTSPANWQWPIYGLDGVDRLERITESFMHGLGQCHGLQVHLLEFAFQPKDVQNALQNANEWSPPPPPAKSNQYQGSFQQLLGVHQLHLEASVQPLMTRHGGVECALFLELRLGQSLTESAWVHVLVWCGLEAFPGDCRGCAEPEEPMSAMQLRLPKGCVCSSLQRVAPSWADTPVGEEVLVLCKFPQLENSEFFKNASSFQIEAGQ
eukprot:g30269.t1